MTAGAIVKTFILLATFSLFVILLLPIRARIGLIIQQIHPNYIPQGEELEILRTLDDALYLSIWAGFFIIIAVMFIVIFRETTEGKEWKVKLP